MKMKLNKGGFNALPRGWYTFKVVEVDDSKYSKFGKLAIKLQTADGREHVETFTLTKPNGEVNEGAINAFSYFAHTCLNDFQVEDFDTDEMSVTSSGPRSFTRRATRSTRRPVNRTSMSISATKNRRSASRMATAMRATTISMIWTTSNDP